MNKQEWIAEFAKEFHAQTQMRYGDCFDIADSMYDTGLSPSEAVQWELSYWEAAGGHSI